jgi:iron complex transport system ATP-binding protein
VNANDCLLSAHQLGLTLGGRTLLQDIDLELRPGYFVGIIGPNGAGKSTLLKILAGIEVADKGEVLLRGTALQSLAPMQRAQQIAWLEQRPQLHWPLQVRQVVALGRLPYRTRQDDAADNAAINQALASCGISQLQQRLFPELSEGEKLLVNLARILAVQSPLILADEPTAALDPRHQQQILSLLRQRASQGAAVVVVLHDLSLAARFCEHLLLLHEGKIVAEGTPRQVLTPEKLRATYDIDAELDPATGTVLVRWRSDA